jgi:hypothetical protein
LRHALHNHPHITHETGDPWAACLAWRGTEPGLLLVDFGFTPWWLAGAAEQQLTAIYCREGGTLRVAVTDASLQASGHAPVEQYAAWLQQHGLCDARIGEALPLAPVHIPKPWGQEVWFTGVEERGVCHFGDAGGSTPIPWLQAALPSGYGGEGPLVLLKILDPDAAEVTGDLYFELHQEKREVYVVTHVDRSAWPDGIGYIRYGFDPDRLEQAASDEAFRQQYHQAVQAYEAVRRQIDEGAGEASAAVQARERGLRAEMDSFTHMRALQTGDVVVVPLLMPHSLQHGVRTIEFQTPVYERKILSFAQQVLTQGHWDTGEAIEQMRLLPPEEVPFEVLERGQGVLVERVVDFPDFEVRRIRIEPGMQLPLQLQDCYGLVMLVEGSLAVSGKVFGPEQALLLPRGAQLTLAPLQAAEPLVLLLALPRA